MFIGYQCTRTYTLATIQELPVITTHCTLHPIPCP